MVRKNKDLIKKIKEFYFCKKSLFDAVCVQIETLAIFYLFLFKIINIFNGILFEVKLIYSKDQNYMKIIFFVFTSLSLFAQSKVDSTKSFNLNPNYQLQIGLQSISKIKQADIVMLGNSITHGCNWNEVLGRNNVVERGIPSDNTEGMLNRLNSIIKLNPKLVFILAGVNDIYSGLSAEIVFTNYVKIISELRKKKIVPVVQSCIYAGEYWGKDWNLTREFNLQKNNEIEKLNFMLKDYCAKNNLEFIDLNSKLSANKFLLPEATYDYLHLNYRGYKIWSAEIEKILIKYGL